MCVYKIDAVVVVVFVKADMVSGKCVAVKMYLINDVVPAATYCCYCCFCQGRYGLRKMCCC